MVFDSFNQLGRTVLNHESDPKLQKIAERASSVSGFPVALLTLVLKRTQIYKAHVGLPPKLAIYQAIDSCLSFCQYVVNTKKPLKIYDATKEQRLPQQLVELYGIRSYYGFPVLVEGIVVGSLCIVDTTPNTISDQVEQEMISLAKEASLRLTEIALQKKKSQEGAEIKLSRSQQSMWSGVNAARDEVQLAITDLYPIVKAIADQEKTKEGDDLDLAKMVLTDATKAYDDLNIALANLDKELEKVKSNKI